MEGLYEWFNNMITEIISLGVLFVFVAVPVGLFMLAGRILGLWRWGR